MVKKATEKTSKVLFLWIMALILVAVSFALGFAASSAVNKNKLQQSVAANKGMTMPVAQQNMASGMVMSTPAMGIQASSDAAGHQDHLASMAKKVSEAAKTGDYSYLLEKVDSDLEMPKIDITEAKYLFDGGKAIFVDARDAGDYEQGHIKGSVSIPTSATPEQISLLKNKLEGKVLVTYCHGTGCHLADKVAKKLYDFGYRNIAIFWGGWPKWNEHKYPVELKKK